MMLRWVVIHATLVWQLCGGQIMSVDLGHEFFKVALMRQGAPLEIVLNPHSKRKTSTAVSFFEAIRAFGDDALPHASKSPAKVPLFFHSQLSYNYSENDVGAGGRWWQNFALGNQFYAYDLEYDVERGVPVFNFGDDKKYCTEEIVANILFFAKKISEESADGKQLKDVVITVPSNANLRYRQSIVSAAEIAGLKAISLVHETSAFAVHRALDLSVEKGKTEYALFYNMGSRKTEVVVAEYQSRQAGMVAGKTAPVVNIVGSAIDFNIGGHIMDLRIADFMLKAFQQKHKSASEGIERNPRALRKLLSQAQKTKAILSANKQAPFIVESLYNDVDFQTQLSRDEFEQMCTELFTRLTQPIDEAIASANLSFSDISHIEVVGGAWRVPKVQQVLSEYFEKSVGKKLLLGQHLNGEEAAALGSALVGANTSSSFRVTKIFFQDKSAHEYSVQVVSTTGEWEKNITKLYPVGAQLGGKKKLAFTLEEDFIIKLFEDDVLISEYSVSGLQELMQGKWSEYNLTGTPKVNVAVHLENNGIIEIKSPTVTCEEVYWVNETKKILGKKSNETQGSSATENASERGGEDGDEQVVGDGESENDADSSPGDVVNASANDGNLSQNSSTADESYEVVQVKKKKKHEKKMQMNRIDYKPLPLQGEKLKVLKKEMEDAAAIENEAAAVNELKNELESTMYGAKDKLENEFMVQVSNEQQRDEITKLCNDIEEWIHEGSPDKHEYEKRLNDLKSLLGPIEERAFEMEARLELPSALDDAITSLREASNYIKKNMSWVNESKIEKAQEKLQEFETWWQSRQEKQRELPLSEAPAYTKVEVFDRLGKVQKEMEKLRKLKKPKEQKKEKKDDKTKNKDDKPTAASTVENLPATMEEVEKELADIKKRKAEAVENEDFDAAQILKVRQETLQKHATVLRENAEGNAEKSEL